MHTRPDHHKAIMVMEWLLPFIAYTKRNSKNEGRNGKEKGRIVWAIPVTGEDSPKGGPNSLRWGYKPITGLADGCLTFSGLLLRQLFLQHRKLYSYHIPNSKNIRKLHDQTCYLSERKKAGIRNCRGVRRKELHAIKKTMERSHRWLMASSLFATVWTVIPVLLFNRLFPTRWIWWCNIT